MEINEFSINGGFFWFQDEPAITMPDIKGTISNCVVFTRPKWYQFRQWYHALKLWLNLPYAKSNDPTSAVYMGTSCDKDQ